MPARLLAQLGDAIVLARFRERADGPLPKRAKMLAVEMLVCHSCRS
jgi:hypothetical protein